ncbi:NnrS protein involved in response to NO [Thioalkalivibrio nitratireducens DSM 14787]|uniref:NnrS protein involved in response to NO n=1 Tax=Thioalkalivibrio nitratireducens (strain DSM 14787 / UNIQEM 213 / ALEN2) TaxID=1255043 RepID=L0DTF4_THIND|nr:NnrS family protein [Thioalkalivibrio nitratireducens]AGA32293.1 NnrS protein involved in response to NO [Thioalkalivibrio nitratireducens DSM 14787]
MDLVPRSPLFLCGFRPFFLLTALTAVIATAAWGGFLLGGMPLPAVPGGPIVWHAHEMILGFALAALVGFLLTATPEFSGTEPVRPGVVATLVLLWLGARLGWLYGGAVGAWATAVFEVALLAALLAIVAPRVLADPERRHTAFAWAVLALLLVVIAFHWEALHGRYPMRWLLVASGVLMTLIVLAMSRVSMRIVNDEIERAGISGTEYLARPPRRNLAILCIGLYTAAEFAAPLHPVSGWLALAAAAALLNLTNDWHIGRALRQPWVWMLYSVYWLIALGFAAMGIAILGGMPGWLGAGRHLLLVGALGVAVYLVMNIAGRIHSGLPLERGIVLPLAVLMLLTAAGMRAAMALGWHFQMTLIASLLCWSLVFGWYLLRFGPLFLRPREDGQEGCAGVAAGTPAQIGEPAQPAGELPAQAARE